MPERLLLLWHFALARWGPRFRSREQLTAFQAKQLQPFLADAICHSRLYHHLAPDLTAFPVMAKSDFLAHFADLNRSGIPLDQAMSLALRAERDRDFTPELPGGVTAGLSSGTSGMRHVFLAGREDRCRWAGRMLGSLLSPASLRRVLNPFAAPLRIALFLRANSNLYTTLSGARVRFAYYDLTRPFPDLVREVSAQRPHILVAPATVLAELARLESARPSGLQPDQVISVAEVLDRRDRDRIEKTFSIRVAEVYQAAEGFLGSTCEAGRIHLHEDMLHIEPRWMDEAHDRFQPIITDFTRTTQWFIRHHLDDILRLNPTPCPCGRASWSLLEIEGRADEQLWARDAAGNSHPVFPDALRQALYSLPQAPGHYRIEQHGDLWRIALDDPDPRNHAAVRAALERLLAGLGLVPPRFEFSAWTPPEPGRKLKRIHCVTPPA